MTYSTKVGVSIVDHMNDDAPEVDSFFRGCYQALSSPPFLRREPGDEARVLRGCKYNAFFDVLGGHKVM